MKRSRWLRAAAVRVMTACESVSRGENGCGDGKRLLHCLLGRALGW